MVKKNTEKTQKRVALRKPAQNRTKPKTLSSKTKPAQSSLSVKSAKTVKKKKTSLTAGVAPLARETKKQQKVPPREEKILDIRKNLVQQKNVLLSEAEEALNSLPGQTVFSDLGDQASAETDRSFMLCLREREQRLLKKVEEAIEKIKSGLFGVCEVCGHEIDIKRLEARPVTTMCIDCKTEQEEEEKIRGV
jgi:DnaK suppressor protein